MSSPSDAGTVPGPHDRAAAPGRASASPPQGRYPAARNTGRALAVILGIGLVALLIGITWVVYRMFTADSVSGETVAYRVIDDRTITVQLLVNRDDPAQPVSCVVRARDRDGSEVGRREVLIPPSDSTAVELTTSITTSAPPGMADVYGCGENIPAYLTGTD